jgi:hypothetical protein
MEASWGDSQGLAVQRAKQPGLMCYEGAKGVCESQTSILKTR